MQLRGAEQLQPLLVQNGSLAIIPHLGIKGQKGLNTELWASFLFPETEMFLKIQEVLTTFTV